MTSRPDNTKSKPTEERVRVIDATTLFADADEIRLKLKGIEYRLRITRQGKLILTK